MAKSSKDNYIFISYAHKDSKKVFPFINKLTEQGISVWYDDSIGPGAEWDEDIAKHILGCRVMLSFVTGNYIKSKNCKDELNFARDKEKDQILIYLEEVDLPIGMQMRINRIQALYYCRRRSDKDFFDRLLSAEAIKDCIPANAPNGNIQSAVLSVDKDKDTDDTVSLISANGEEIEFYEIAGIAYKGSFYAILQPVELLEGMDEDEALVFKVTRGNDGEDRFEIELDDDVIDNVFKIYEQLWKDQNK